MTTRPAADDASNAVANAAQDPAEGVGAARSSPRRSPQDACVSALACAATTVVCAVAGAGLVLAWAGYWRRGVLVLAAALLLAGAFRLLLPQRWATGLVNRSRAFDVICSVVLGSCTGALAAMTPPPVF